MDCGVFKALVVASLLSCKCVSVGMIMTLHNRVHKNTLIIS